MVQEVKCCPLLFWRISDRELTCVLDLHVGERLQRVLEGDALQVERSDAVVLRLGVGDELVGHLLDLLRGQVPSQPVLRADRRRAAKHHLTWDNEKPTGPGQTSDNTDLQVTGEDAPVDAAGTGSARTADQQQNVNLKVQRVGRRGKQLNTARLTPKFQTLLERSWNAHGALLKRS